MISTRKGALTLAVAGAMAAPNAAGLSVKFSGHVNRAIRYVDDGVASDVQHVDYSGSGSRLRWRGQQKINRDLRVGAHVEIRATSNESFRLGLKEGDPEFADLAGRLRYSEIWVRGKWGELHAGLTGGASWAADTHSYFTNTAMDPTGGFLTISSIRIRRKDNGAPFTWAFFVTSSMSVGRRDVLKYVSPWLDRKLKVAAAIYNDDMWDVSAQFRTKISSTRFKANIAYLDGKNRRGYTGTLAGAGLLFPQGTSIQGNYGQQALVSGRERRYWSGVVGHNWGNNRFQIRYYRGKDMQVDEDATTQWTVTYVHEIPKVKTELYAHYGVLDYDHPSVATRDINYLFLGSRVKF